MEKLTFEQLPEAVALLLEKVNRIEQLLAGNKTADVDSKEMLTINEAAAYMGLSLSSLYKMTHRRELPVYKPSGGKVYLRKPDILEFLSRHRLMSQNEINQEAINYVNNYPANKKKK